MHRNFGLRPYFHIHPYHLGDNIGGIITSSTVARNAYADYVSADNFYERLAAEPQVEYADISRVFTDSQISRNTLAEKADFSIEDKPIEEQGVLVGFFNGEEQLKPIIKNKLYYTRSGFRPGSLRMTREAIDVRYLFLHQKDKFYLFYLKDNGPRIATGASLKKKGFPNNHPEEAYLIYDLASDKPISFDNIDIQKAILQGIGNQLGNSYFTTLKKLFNL